MNDVSLIKKIFILFVLLFLCLDASASIFDTLFGSPPEHIHCALNTDCKLIYYTATIEIPTVEKADYRCHITQKMNTGPTGILSTVTVGTPYIIDEAELGGGHYEENIYIPSRKITEKGHMLVYVERSQHSSVWHWDNKRKPEIIVNCIKL